MRQCAAEGDAVKGCRVGVVLLMGLMLTTLSAVAADTTTLSAGPANPEAWIKTWSGYWNMKPPISFRFEKIAGAKAIVVYKWGSYSGWGRITPGEYTAEGAWDGERFIIALPQERGGLLMGGSVAIKMNSDGSLAAKYSHPQGYFDAILKE